MLSFEDHARLSHGISPQKNLALGSPTCLPVHKLAIRVSPHVYVLQCQSRASGCSASDYHGVGSGSSSKHGARGEDRASASVCKKITDSIYELYTPSTSHVEMEIVFFHGLFIEKTSVPHLSTWRSGYTEGLVWPKHWLPEDYPAARVLTIAYDASLEKDAKHGRMDLYLITESLLEDLRLANVGKTCPIVLVGHCVGGLVIKELCLSAYKIMSLRPEATQRMLTFLQNIRGIFYYGTPHLGIKFSNFLEKLKKEGELVGIMRVLNKDLARLNQDFQSLCKRYKWHIAGVSETQASDLGGGLSQVIVEEASSRCEGTISVSEDHFSICRPSTKQSNTYQYLVSFIKDQLKVTEEINNTSIPGDFQILPRIQVGTLSSLTGGQIEKTLEMFSAVGLWGMGGIGKTTLAKAAFNHLHIKFEYSLFIENIKLILISDARKFREELLQQMHHKGRMMQEIPDMATLWEKDLLVVLDDVEMDRDIGLVDELQAICSQNSRFILTSRDREILNKVDRISIMEVNGLEKEEAETLFKSYAIPYYGPLLQWQSQCSKDIVEKCQGLPLILEVVGKYLSTGEESVWRQTLNTLCAADDDSVGIGVVWSKLRVSYDSLRDEEKQMFIEASTFFQGWRLRDDEKWTLRQAKVAWNVAYTNEAIYWKTLVDRSLVYDVAEDSEIKMHEHLRSLGHKLAKAMPRNMRIRLTTEELRSFYRHNKNHELEKVHTIHVVSKGRKTSTSFCRVFRKPFDNSILVHNFPRISIVRLQAMKNLHYLQLDKCTLARRTMLLPRTVLLPGNLIIFHSEGIGQNISFKSCTKLVCLTMKASGIKRLHDSFRTLSNLQFFHLHSVNLKCLPEFFSSFHKLHTCTLRCNSLTELPIFFGGLGNLHQMGIWSDKLERLPESFGGLGNLQQLEIQSNKLERLPESFGDLGNLQKLKIKSDNLERLPESFGGLGNLQQLTIKSDNLERLAESFGGLGNLQQLEIQSDNLKRLPESFGGLGNLQKLTIESDNLERLPESFGGLGNLQQLTIWSDNIERLSESFGGLGNLQQLLIWSNKLERLPESFLDLGNLQKLKIKSDNLERLPESFGGLGNLQQLTIKCDNLERLPESFGALGNLQQLVIWSDKLERLPESFGGLGNLQILEIWSDKLERLPESFGGLGNLQILEIWSDKLERLPECFGGLGNLQQLEIWLAKLERLPESFGGLGNLQQLKIWSDKLERLPESFGGLGNLQRLEIQSDKLERLPESFGGLGNLQRLKIQSDKLERLPESFGGLGNLQELEIRSLKLERLPETFGGLGNLQ